MWTYLFSFLLLRRMGLSKPIRYALAVFLIGLILAGSHLHRDSLSATFGKDESNP